MSRLKRNEHPTTDDKMIARRINDGMKVLGSEAQPLRKVQPVQDELIQLFEDSLGEGWLRRIARKLRGDDLPQVKTAAANARWYLEGAKVDLQTGLPTRVAFAEKIEETLAEIERGGIQEAIVMQFDLNSFKAINDTYGAACGDRAIQIFADAMRHSIREHIDSVAYRKQAGGDEFYLLIRHWQDQNGESISSESLRERVVRRIYANVSIVMQGEDFRWEVRGGDASQELKNSQGHYYYAAVGAIVLSKENLDELGGTEGIFSELERLFKQDKEALKAGRS